MFAQAHRSQAESAADSLRRQHLNGDLRRALETALAVCYARPYTRCSAGALGSDWAPQDDDGRGFHAQLLRLRDQVYAHNDLTSARDIVDTGAMLGLESHYAEAWTPMRYEALQAISELCRQQRSQFREGARSLQTTLNAGTAAGDHRAGNAESDPPG